MNVTKVAMAAGLGWAMLTGAASAASLTTVGTWGNSTPSGTITGEGSSQISWGIPVTGDGQSSYIFDGVNETVDVADLTGSNFLLGEFTHNNFPVFASGNNILESTTLSVDFSLDANNTLFTFNFDHFETPNNGTPCAAGGAQPCPDLVSFTNSVSSETITLDGIDYNLSLIGFSQDGGNTLVDEFLTLENQSNTAGLYAQLTQVPTESVPEPASLLGILLVGGAATTLKLKQQQA